MQKSVRILCSTHSVFIVFSSFINLLPTSVHVEMAQAYLSNDVSIRKYRRKYRPEHWNERKKDLCCQTGRGVGSETWLNMDWQVLFRSFSRKVRLKSEFITALPWGYRYEKSLRWAGIRLSIAIPSIRKLFWEIFSVYICDNLSLKPVCSLV